VIDPPDLGRVFPWIARVALLIAIVGAVVLARRHAAYRLTATFLVWVGVAHVVRPLLQVFILAPARAAHGLPYVGAARPWYHLDQALFVSWPIGIAALAVHAFWRRRPWPVAVAYVAVVAGLALGYPTVRRELLASVYLGVTLAALAVSIGAGASWWPRRARSSPPEIVAFLLILFEIAALIGPYGAGIIDKTWPIAQGIYLVLFAAIAALEVAWARRR
jgi:hypothetical protein